MAVVELIYKDAEAPPGNQLLYRDNEPALEVVTVSLYPAGRALWRQALQMTGVAG